MMMIKAHRLSLITRVFDMHPDNKTGSVQWEDPRNMWYQCVRLRMMVFADEQNLPRELEVDRDDFSPDTHHFLLIDLASRGDDGLTPTITPVAYCRLIHGNKIGRVVSHPLYRKQGHASTVLRAAIECAFESSSAPPDTLHLSSQTYATRVYGKVGFVAGKEGEFDILGIPHVKMCLHREHWPSVKDTLPAPCESLVTDV